MSDAADGRALRLDEDSVRRFPEARSEVSGFGIGENGGFVRESASAFVGIEAADGRKVFFVGRGGCGRGLAYPGVEGRRGGGGEEFEMAEEGD